MNKNEINTLHHLPLPWKQSFINNELYMDLDVNEYFSISIPTGFYCANSNSSIVDPSLKNNTNILFNWKKRKIEIEKLYKFVLLSSMIYKKYKSEFAACIFHNTITDEYELLVPVQTISGGSVTYSPSNGFKEYKDMDKKNCIVDMHSHHTMTIGFSATDNHSDSIVGAIGSISLVIKGIDKFDFVNLDNSIDVRLNIQGKNYRLSVYDIFEDTDELFNMIDKGFIDRPSERTIPVFDPTPYYSYPPFPAGDSLDTMLENTFGN